MVSVIVPVYNVEKYIDKCMESLVNQTYQNLEIILVDDKSLDSSSEHCVEWTKKDSRVRLIVNEENKGLAGARNVGLRQASGEYVLFVDSDDWLDTNYIEVLRADIIRTNADMVAGSSFYEVTQEKTSVVHKMPEGHYLTEEEKQLLLCGGNCCAWMKLYRREWMLEHDLWQVSILRRYEDAGIYPFLLMHTNRIYVSAYPGYYYRCGRVGSLMNDEAKKMVLDAIKLFSYLLERWNKTGNQMPAAMKFYLIREYHYQFRFPNLDTETLSLLEQAKTDMLVPHFGNFDFFKPNYLVLGSFSLRWEVQKGCLLYQKVDKHYCFSSLISMVSHWKNHTLEQEVIHENAFRKKQIEQELTGSIWQNLKEVNGNTLFFLDFLEERFDILQLEDGSYLTDSEAFRESNLKDISYVKRIESGSPEFMNLWKQSCDQLVLELERHLRPEQVVLVKNRMSMTYGNAQKRQMFADEQKLKNINWMLEQLEEYFLQKMPLATQIESKTEDVFVDEYLNYGCQPEYSNNTSYMQVGLQIFDKILNIKNL